jgi:hypothetical protein
VITIASARNPRRMRCHRIPTSEGRGVATPLPCVHHSANVAPRFPRSARSADPTSMHFPDTRYSILSSGLANRPTDQRINKCGSPNVVTRSRPYLWIALAPGSMHPPPATRSCHPPPGTCLSHLHLCTGRRPICTFATRAARGAAPTSLPLSVQPSLWASGPLVTHVPLPPCPLPP